MKILLIVPHSELNKNVPNIGIGYIGSSLKQLGYEVKVIDFNLKPGDIRERYEKTDLVGISITSNTYKEAQRITRLIRERDKDVKIVWGGVHCILMSEKLIEENPEVDHFVIGEGEYFTKYLNGKMCSIPFIDNLDSLPFPTFRMFDSYDEIRKLRYPIICSRGCPYSCIYCAVPKISGRKVRYRSIENCMQELEMAKKDGFRNIQILDDNWSFDINWAKAFCREIKKLGILWGCPNGLRADRFDEELAQLMVESGCYQVQFGVESANKEVFDKIKKGETLEDIEKAINIAKKYGLRVGCYFIIGLPGSTFEKDFESLQWMAKNNVTGNFGMLVPYYGTEAYNMVDRKTDIGSHFGKMAYPTFELEGYSREDMMDAFLLFNSLCNSGFTEEWYRDNNKTLNIMVKDLLERAEKHNLKPAMEVRLKYARRMI